MNETTEETVARLYREQHGRPDPALEDEARASRQDPFENSPLHDATVESVEASEAFYRPEDWDEEDEAEEARRLNEADNASPVPGKPVGWDGQS